MSNETKHNTCTWFQLAELCICWQTGFGAQSQINQSCCPICLVSYACHRPYFDTNTTCNRTLDTNNNKIQTEYCID